MKNKEKNNPKGAYFLNRILFSLIVLCYCIPATPNSIKEQINLPDNNVVNTVGKVLNYIEKNSDYIFIYQDAKIDLDRKVSVSQTSQAVNEILDTIFAGTDIRYTIKNRQIAIYRSKSKKQELPSLPVIDQESKTITGIVRDLTNEPIPGVNVIVKGTTIGTTTDTNGRYSLANIPQTASILIFSFVGMASQEIAIGKQAVINVIMQEDAVTLDDVVAIGYGSQKKESLTSAITSVNTELLENRSIPKVATALQGITPGVNIRQITGRPGYSAYSLDIRGASLGTFSSNEALVLIDGIVAGIDEVNPNDIEKISVLKDAAAAAIYGSRATGGVILITTKKGITGKTTISYNGTIGTQKNPITSFGDKMIDSQTWLRASNEGRINDGDSPIYSDEYIAQFDGSDPLKPNKTVWFDWLKKNALQHIHDISVRGGTEKINIYASAGFVSQDGIFDNDDYKKLNFQANVNWKATDRIEINLNTYYSKEDITRPIINIPTSLRCTLNPPTDVFRYPNGVYNKGSLPVGDFNVAQAMAEGGNSLYDYDKYRLSMDLRYKIIDGLYLKYVIASNNNFNQSNSFTTLMDKYDSEGNYTGSATASGGAYATASEDWFTNRYLSNLITLDYTYKNNNHAITVLGGFQTESNRVDKISARANKFVNNELRELAASTGSGTDLYGTSSAEEWAMASFIGRASYSFREKYIMELTARYDGSSRFSPDGRWGFFPSISAAWRVTEENWMKQLDWLNNLKIRASWGKLGNQGTSLYPFFTNVSISSWAFGNGTSSTTSIGTPADLNLSWESKSTTNIGFDLGLLNNKINGSFDWFYDHTKNIIGTPTVPSTFGASSPVQNTYTIDNRGWEFEVKWTDNIGDFKYYVGVNLSNSHDKVVSLGGLGSTDPRYDKGFIVLNPSAGTYYAEGKPRNCLYLFETDGLFVDQNEIDNYIAPSSLTKPGDIKFIDRNNDKEITSDDRYLSDKTTTPHYIYGINLGGEYKGFDLSVIFNGVGERWGFRNLDGHYMTGNRLDFSMFKTIFENRWTPENPNKWADQPRLTNNNWLSGDYCTMFPQPCEYHLRNFKFIRLKNIQIGYTLPKKWTNKLSISKLRVFFTGENLFYIAPGYKEYVDPEAFWSTIADNGASSIYFGPSKTLSGGLSVIF